MVLRWRAPKHRYDFHCNLLSGELMAMWAINSVRAAPPDIEICIGQKLYRAVVAGRLEKFAKVSTISSEKYNYCIEFSWQSIVNSLKNNTPLLG